MRTTGALHFQERSSSMIAYGIQTNSSPKQIRGVYEDSVFTFQVPLQVAAEREITRLMAGDSSIEWSVTFKEFAHPQLATSSIVATGAPVSFLAATMIGFVIQMGNLVDEKEQRLRQAISIMGLLDSAYWLSWLLWEITLALISSILYIFLGMMFQFSLYLHNSFGILFFLCFLFQFSMVGLAFVLSTFVNNSASARTAGFVVFIVGFLTQLVTAIGFPYNKSFPKVLQVIWSIFPPNLLAIATQYLVDTTSTTQGNGISWASRARCPSVDPNCVLTLDQVYKWLTTTFFAWFFLAMYLDNVLKDVNGVRKSWFYFLKPSYWAWRASSQDKDGDSCCCMGSLNIPSESIAVDEDVAEEERFVREQAARLSNPNIAVQVCGLVKTYPGTKRCYKCKSTPAYQAVKSLWVHIEKNKIFCLLGPNGAGKTTTINCLTGIIPVTSGDALVYGDSIRSTQGMARIRSHMGVCPQFDVLWDALTGLEHLSLFASIKGLPSSVEKQMSADLLSEVGLSEVANLRVGSYSGGMKRRLSVAISLIGDPKIVYLDEPTAGMDPITRRHVWDIIERAKRGRAIILTTHSMEEADVLSDRIAIMAKGKLGCIGTSLHLKSRFGAGYIISVSLTRVSNEWQSPQEGDLQTIHLKKMFEEQLGVQPKEENDAFITFIIPRDKESKLVDFVTTLQEKEAELGIADIQISLTTLEDVFLNIARQAELETAAAEGWYETVILANGDSLQVLPGADFVAIPDTKSKEHPYGMMIQLEWQQDDNGRLCLAKQSKMIPSPPPHHVPSMLTTRSKTHGPFSSC